jgi:hypothetical protein
MGVSPFIATDTIMIPQALAQPTHCGMYIVRDVASADICQNSHFESEAIS